MKFVYATLAIASIAASSGAQVGTIGTPAGNVFPAGLMFDVTALHPQGLRLWRWEIRLETTFDIGPIIRMYHRSDSYVGHENSSAGWSVLGEHSIPAPTSSQQIYEVVMPTLDVPTGQTAGLFMTVINYDLNHTPHISGIGARGEHDLRVNADVRLEGGVSKVAAMGGDPFATQTITPAFWTGRITYTPIPEPGTAIALVIGVAGLALRARAGRRKSCDKRT